MSNKKWILKDAGESDVHYRIFMDDTEVTEQVCDIYRTTDDELTGKNARLAFAAPYLLEALLKLQDVIERAAAQNCVHAIETDEVNMINAAIAKAVNP